MLPLSTVASPPFKQFINLLRPEYQLPAVRELKSLITEKYNTSKSEVVAQLAPPDKDTTISRSHWKANTFDMWMGPHNYGVLGMTAHWIAEFTLQSRIIGTVHFVGEHTAARIHQKITEIWDDWKISGINNLICY